MNLHNKMVEEVREMTQQVNHLLFDKVLTFRSPTLMWQVGVEAETGTPGVNWLFRQAKPMGSGCT